MPSHLPGQRRCPPGQVMRNGQCVRKEQAHIDIINDIKEILTDAEKEYGIKLDPDTLKALDQEIDRLEKKLEVEKSFWGDVLFKDME